MKKIFQFCFGDKKSLLRQTYAYNFLAFYRLAISLQIANAFKLFYLLHCGILNWAIGITAKDLSLRLHLTKEIN